MFVKRYIAADAKGAMERIRQELGPDAYILTQRSVRKKGFWGFFQRRLVEITAAVEGPEDRKREADQKRQEALRQAAEAVLAERAKKGIPSLVSSPAPRKEVPPTPLPVMPVEKDVKKEPDPPRPAVQEEITAEREPDRVLREGVPLSAQEVRDQLTEIKGAVRELSDRMASVDGEGTGRYAPSVLRLYHTLLGQRVTSELTKRICDAMQHILDRSKGAPMDVAKELLAGVLGEAQPLRLKKYQQTVIMMIGPTGVGKTTTLVKLAGKYTIEEGLKVGLVNSDTFRVAAQEQMKTYAEIMEVPCITVYAPEEMGKALGALSDRDVIFVDTAGKSTSDAAYHELMRAYLQKSGADEILLAVSASMAPSVVEEMIQNFSYLSDYKIVITKLDEISTLGHILNIADYAKQPICCLTTGQNVPQDMMEPNFEGIIRHVLESAEL